MSDEQNKPPADVAAKSGPTERDLQRLQLVINCMELASTAAGQVSGFLIGAVAVLCEDGHSITRRAKVAGPSPIVMELLLTIIEELLPVDFHFLFNALATDPRFGRTSAPHLSGEIGVEGDAMAIDASERKKDYGPN